MNREGNWDLLRIISCIAVIMIHVSGVWFDTDIEQVITGTPIDSLVNPFSACFYNSISRFAVPCFLMLSGAFILDSASTRDYRTFYSKSFRKLGVPTIIFSVIYILYRLPFCFIGETSGISGILDLIKRIFCGWTMSHMWYLYMLLGIYAMAPIVKRFKDSITEESFFHISIVFGIMASLSRWTTAGVELSWDIGQTFEYLGYFMIGYCIRKRVQKKNTIKGCIAILLGGGI